MVTYLDGKFVDDADAVISVRSRALNYGLGCFGGSAATSPPTGGRSTCSASVTTSPA
ncbi:hypothetical protein [Nannocystis pusilla]|uniref:hypothetical protein n=1 Tax=Nannocystis pusilla TaxID=889268 RepID=UPI003DA6C561